MEELKEKRLSRVDFSILITITVALCSIWRIIGAETLDGGILAGAYFFMGLFLCFVKSKEIFGSVEAYKKLSETTAYVFFNSWFYVLLIYFVNYTTQKLLPTYCWIILIVVVSIILMWMFEKGYLSFKKIYKFLTGFLLWYVVSLLITMILSFNLTVTLDKDFYDYEDMVYITINEDSKFKEKIPVIFVDNAGLEITNVSYVSGNTYAMPASELFGKDVYAVCSYPFKFKKEKILQYGNLNKISYRARINRIDLNIRLPKYK